MKRPTRRLLKFKVTKSDKEFAQLNSGQMFIAFCEMNEKNSRKKKIALSKWERFFFSSSSLRVLLSKFSLTHTQTDSQTQTQAYDTSILETPKAPTHTNTHIVTVLYRWRRFVIHRSAARCHNRGGGWSHGRWWWCDMFDDETGPYECVRETVNGGGCVVC